MKYCPHCGQEITPIPDAERAKAYRVRKGATPKPAQPKPTDVAKPIHKAKPPTTPIEPDEPTSLSSMLGRMLDK